MNFNTSHTAGDTVPAFPQWQWEEAVNLLRRRTDESILQRHWSTTGDTVIDATARAHIAEWWALDVTELEPGPDESVLEAMVRHTLSEQHWDLYVVEDQGDEQMTVRRLHRGQGSSIRWLEGRTPPPVGSTVALRVGYLESTGRTVATLPLVFGDSDDAREVIRALLRAFGDRAPLSWEQFMRGVGARIVLEHGLARLRQCAGGRNAAPDSELETAVVQLQKLHEAFSRLENAVEQGRFATECALEQGRVGWVEDVAAGPHLLVFDSREAHRRYRRTPAVAGLAAPGCSAAWCRVRRIDATEVTRLERALADRAGLDVEQDGLVRLQRRNRRGAFVDLEPDDYRAVCNACRRMAGRRHRRSAA